VHEATKPELRAARERVTRYYETELAKLVERVEEAIARYRPARSTSTTSTT
jgi:hypothetical protein